MKHLLYRMRRPAQFSFGVSQTREAGAMMKKILCVLSMAICVFISGSRAQSAGPSGEPVKFKEYNIYYVNPDYEMRGGKIFFAFDDPKKFDEIFLGAPRVGKEVNNVIATEEDFESRIVVAFIKSGGNREYSNIRVTAKEGKLFVWYTAGASISQGPDDKSLLILGIERGDYNEVVFMENGRRDGSVALVN